MHTTYTVGQRAWWILSQRWVTIVEVDAANDRYTVAYTLEGRGMGTGPRRTILPGTSLAPQPVKPEA